MLESGSETTRCRFLCLYRIQSKIGCWFGGHFCKKILMPSITIKKIKWNLLYTIKRVYFHKNSVWLAYFKYKMAKFVRIYSKIGQKPSFCLQIFQTVHQKVCYKAIEKQNYPPFVIILEGWWYNLTIRTIIIQKFEKIYIFLMNSNYDCSADFFSNFWKILHFFF